MFLPDRCKTKEMFGISNTGTMWILFNFMCYFFLMCLTSEHKEVMEETLTHLADAGIGTTEKRKQSGDNEANPHSYFAGSIQVHSPRPEYGQFRAGQVISHKRFGYSGVIVRWDVKADTPEEWLQPKYPPRKQDLKNTPHYRILINKANGLGKSTAYVPEEEITIIMGLEVHRPDMETCLRGYDGSKYIMQPWLKKLYPHD